jgi:hypothetical protein
LKCHFDEPECKEGEEISLEIRADFFPIVTGTSRDYRDASTLHRLVLNGVKERRVSE